MNIQSSNGRIAIEQPVFTKIEAKISNGFATNSNRINLIESVVVWNFKITDSTELEPGDIVILRGDAGLYPWAKQKFIFGDKDFVLCPVSDIIGYKKTNNKQVYQELTTKEADKDVQF